MRVDPPARRVAALLSHPFQLRGLARILGAFPGAVAVYDLAAIEAYRPDVVLVNEDALIRPLRDYCDAHQATLIGLRHGTANKYIGPGREYAHVDWLCASDWDVEDFTSHGIRPRNGFWLTGNPWVDDVFALPARPVRRQAPHILFAPTYNPETSAAAVLATSLLPIVRRVFPASPITIKPHPVSLHPDSSWARDLGYADVFRAWNDAYREAARQDRLVRFIDAPDLPVSACYADADILVSDGSSLIFDFMVLDRPILLFSSDQRVKVWEDQWDPAAMANRMRDVGVEFGTTPEFEAALASVVERHLAVHSAVQRTYVERLFGRFRDGQSWQRVATRIAALRAADTPICGERQVADG